ncbi:hypothetical protein VTN00DRAFT_3936 [Thermoascus crustaceus]|uniref:uncharacterized protein n=1 Tax=Thermoascus crustaceus TaxID=5088 RepID=UPI00374263EE
MEGILPVGLEIPDAERVRALHGDDHRRLLGFAVLRRRRHSYNGPPLPVSSLQAVISLGQLYGDVLYYATSMFDHYILGLSYSRPEASYFWGYFVFLNAFGIVVPPVLFNSVMASGRAFSALEKVAKKML